MKKLLFPFYKDRHKFLVQKWWFRSLILAYFVWLPVSPFFLGFSYLDDQTSWCYDSLNLYADWSRPGMEEAWDSHLEGCQKIAQEAWTPAIGIGVLGAPLLNLLVQFLFFKVLMDFVVLGVRFKQNDKADPI